MIGFVVAMIRYQRGVFWKNGIGSQHLLSES
jgi:hypothetical protein